jgi:hypothetical protein
LLWGVSSKLNQVRQIIASVNVRLKGGRELFSCGGRTGKNHLCIPPLNRQFFGNFDSDQCPYCFLAPIFDAPSPGDMKVPQMAVPYDDNFGFWTIEEPEEREFFEYIQRVNK